MNDSYKILGLPVTATDSELRARYLELVREFPPEREPERFAKIRAAYDAVRDPVTRLTNRLLVKTQPQPFSEIRRQAEQSPQSRRISTRTLLSLGEP